MPQPQVADNLLIARLNTLKRVGVFLDKSKFNDRSALRELEIEIAKLRGVSIAAYYGLSSSLAALSGDVQTVRAMLKNMRSVVGVDAGWLVHVVQSLVILGMYSEAHKAFSDCFASFSAEEAGSKLKVASSVYAISYMADYVPYLDRCAIAGLEEGVLDMAREIVAAASSFSVSEDSVRRMMDAAGRAFSINKKIIQSTGFSADEDSICIYLTVKGTPEDAAKIEWDYTGEVFKDFPDAPFDKVSVIVESI